MTPTGDPRFVGWMPFDWSGPGGEVPEPCGDPLAFAGQIVDAVSQCISREAIAERLEEMEGEIQIEPPIEVLFPEDDEI